MDGTLDEENQMNFGEVILFGLLLFMLFAFVIGDIPEGYEDADGFHYGRKENK